MDNKEKKIAELLTSKKQEDLINGFKKYEDERFLQKITEPELKALFAVLTSVRLRSMVLKNIQNDKSFINDVISGNQPYELRSQAGDQYYGSRSQNK